MACEPVASATTQMTMRAGNGKATPHRTMAQKAINQPARIAAARPEG
jgi:hypothetical protein